jgi:predicted metal-dependent hydrolase
MRAFAGQEGHHANAHERLIAMLRAQGYDLEPFFRQYLPYTRFVLRRAPPLSRLAATARTSTTLPRSRC